MIPAVRPATGRRMSRSSRAKCSCRNRTGSARSAPRFSCSTRWKTRCASATLHVDPRWLTIFIATLIPLADRRDRAKKLSAPNGTNIMTTMTVRLGLRDESCSRVRRARRTSGWGSCRTRRQSMRTSGTSCAPSPMRRDVTLAAIFGPATRLPRRRAGQHDRDRAQPATRRAGCRSTLFTAKRASRQPRC